MRRGTWILVAVACAIVLGMLIVSQAGSARQDDVSAPQGVSAQQVVSPPIYDPYPPGLLPADLQAEIDRVVADVDQIFAAALAQRKWSTSITRAIR